MHFPFIVYREWGGEDRLISLCELTGVVLRFVGSVGCACEQSDAGAHVLEEIHVFSTCEEQPSRLLPILYFNP